MNKAELEHFKQVLEPKEAELAKALRRRDEIAIERSPDQIDEVTRAAERELAIRNMARESRQLKDVQAALWRVDKGSFGVCASCEEDISPKRLAAVPWALLCIRCQEDADRQNHPEEERMEALLPKGELTREAA
jgi:DnaK suppressor protein